MALGDVVLKPGLDMPREDLKGLVEHEAWPLHPDRHRAGAWSPQLAVLSATGAIIVVAPFVVRHRRAGGPR